MSTQEDFEQDDSLLPVDEHVEEVAVNGKKVRRKGVYLLPNLVTTGALFSGFYAVISAIGGNFETASIMIFVAMLLDGLDGRIARMTNTQSEFGVQYDSLSDMMSFGVAPALVVYQWGLAPLGKFGLAAAFLYAACGALRLARFNTQVGVVDKRYFIGLASPSAAALVAGMVWVMHDVDVSEVGVSLSLFAALVTAFAGVLMVLNVKYNSFKEVNWQERVPFVAMLAIVMIFFVVASKPSVVLLTAAALYALSGPATFLWRKIKHNHSS